MAGVGGGFFLQCPGGTSCSAFGSGEDLAYYLWCPAELVALALWHPQRYSTKLWGEGFAHYLWCPEGFAYRVWCLEVFVPDSPFTILLQGGRALRFRGPPVQPGVGGQGPPAPLPKSAV